MRPASDDERIAMLASRRIHFSEFVEIGTAYIVMLPDEREPISWIDNRPVRPMVETLVVNPKTMGMA